MPENCVCIKYNGYVLTPTPMISVSSSFQEVGGRNVGSTLTISIEGTIVPGPRPDDLATTYPCATAHVGIAEGSEPKDIIYEQEKMRAVFLNSRPNLSNNTHYNQSYVPPHVDGNEGVAINDDNQRHYFEMKVDGKIVIAGHARVTSYNSNSENFYLNTIKYTAELVIEEHTKLFDDDDSRYLISSYTDTINIEAIDENNPFNSNDPIINTYFMVPMSNNRLGYDPVLAQRYRISRNISAVGKHSSNYNNNSVTVDGEVDGPDRFGGRGTAFSNARLFVLNRLKHYPTNFLIDSTYTLVNRVRILDNNESEGSFGVTENSLAMHKNQSPWIDDWTAEVSTDNTFLMTVRINGTIKGLEVYSENNLNETGEMYGVTPVTFPTPVSSQNTADTYKTMPKGLEPNGVVGTSSAIGLQLNNAGRIGKYQNALRGLRFLKEHTSSTDTVAYQRASIFASISKRPGNNTINPLAWSNNATLINNINAIPSTSTQFYMNPVPVSMTESHRPAAGEIDYTFEFNTRPLNMIQGSLSETLSISDTFPTQQIAEIFVLGRKLGPVLQDLGTVTSSTRDVSFEVVIPRPRQLSQRFIFPTNVFDAVVGVVEQLNPKYTFGVSANPAANIKSYVKADNQTYDPLEGRIRVQKTWVWQRAV